MGRALFLVVFALVGWGCSSGPPPAPPRPLVMAVLPAPELGAALSEGGADEEGEPGLSGGDFLLEVATQLSAEARLDLCLVPGPLLSAALALKEEGDQEEALEEALIGLSEGLGQIAAAVYVGLTEAEAQRSELLEALKASVRAQTGEASVWGQSVLGWRPVALSAGRTLAEVETAAKAEAQRSSEAEGGEAPELDEEALAEIALPLVLVCGDPRAASSDPRLRLRVVRGKRPELLAVGSSLELRVPPLSAGLYALAVLHADRLEIEWRSAEPERVEAPAAQTLPWPQQAP